MKTKLLLIYGYFLPILTSILLSLLPIFIDINFYLIISDYLKTNLEVLLGFLTLMLAIIIPFQNSIISEDNPHILAVLKKSETRKVFISASIFQAVLIVISTLFILITSIFLEVSKISGCIQLLSFCLISFESLALISNGREYQKIREKIIDGVNKASRNDK